MQATPTKAVSPTPALIDQLEFGAVLRQHFSRSEPTEVVLLNVEVHCTGDEQAAAQQVAGLLLKYCRPSDSVARVSHARFLVACTGDGRSSAFELAELLRVRILHNISSGGTGQQHFDIQRVSIGISGSFSNYERASTASLESQQALEEADDVGGISLAYRSGQEVAE